MIAAAFAALVLVHICLVAAALLGLLESWCPLPAEGPALHIAGRPNGPRLSLWQSTRRLLGLPHRGYPLWCGYCGTEVRGRWLWGYRFDCSRGRPYFGVRAGPGG